MTPEPEIALVDAWQAPEAGEFFRNVWPMYVHELSGFDPDIYVLDRTGRWLPHLADQWVSSVTAPCSLRIARSHDDAAQPFQRTHVIARDGRPVGFACVGVQPFKHMPADADLTIAEFFLIHASRGNATASRALELLLRRYSGRWYLRALRDNTRAIRFWRKALPQAGVREFDERRENGDVAWRFVAGG